MKKLIFNSQQDAIEENERVKNAIPLPQGMEAFEIIEEDGVFFTWWDSEISPLIDETKYIIE